MLLFTVFLLLADFICFSQKDIDSLLRIVENTNDPFLKFQTLNKVAYRLRVSNPDSTILLAETSLKLASELDDSLGMAEAKMQVGIGHTSLGSYYEALKWNLDAMTLFESQDSKENIASSLSNIGRVYNFIEDNDKALEYYQKAARVFSELKYFNQEAALNNNIGFIKKGKLEFDSAIYYLKKSRYTAKKSNGVFSEMYPIYNMGSVYMEQNLADSAFKYLQLSLGFSKKSKNQYILSLSLIDIGKMYMKLDDLGKAEKHFIEAYGVTRKANLRSERKDATKYLAIIYELQNKPKKSLKFYKEFKQTDDSLFNRDLAKQMAFQEAEFTFKKQQSLEKLERSKEQLVQEKLLNDAIWIRNSLIAGLAAMALIFFLLYINFSRKRLANLALKKLNRQIELQAEELIKVNREIRVMNDNLETTVNKRTEQLKIRNEQLKEYLSSNSHIVRAPLARILGLVDLYKSKDDEHLDFIINSLNDSALELDTALRDINEKLSKENI